MDLQHSATAQHRLGAPHSRALVSMTRAGQYGPFLLALFLLSTSRWGSYALPGPPYVADLALAYIALDRLTLIGRPGSVLSPINPRIGFLIGGLLALALVTFLLGPVSMGAMRDSAPFFYGAIAFLTVPLSGVNASRAKCILYPLLWFHLLWTTAALALPSIATQAITPGNNEVAFLSLRADVDGLVNGIAASLGLYRFLTGHKHGFTLFIWGTVLVLISHSRISLVATVILLFCTARYASSSFAVPEFLASRFTLAWRRRGIRRRSFMSTLGVIFGIIVICAGAYAFSPTAVERLEGTFGAEGVSGPARQAAGTTRARKQAWNALESWMLQSESRAVFGAGFGENIMESSGAGMALVQHYAPTLRAPHNFLLNVWAHLGITGVAIVVLMIGTGLWLARQIPRFEMTEVDLFAVLVVIGVPVIAMTGVVLEAPFGAIPYFWALGQLGTRVIAPRSDSLTSCSEVV